MFVCPASVRANAHVLEPSPFDPLSSVQVWGLDVCCALLHRFGRMRAAAAAAAQGTSGANAAVGAKVRRSRALRGILYDLIFEQDTAA